MIKALVRAQHWQDALCSTSKPETTPAQHAVVMNALARMNSWKLLVSALQDWDRLIFINIVVTAMDRSCNWQWACAMLAGLTDRRLDADVITCTSSVGACFNAWCWEMMLKLMSENQTLSVGSDAVQNVATAAFSKTLDWKRAFLLLGSRRLQRLELSKQSCTAAMKSCEASEKSDRWELSCKILNCATTSDVMMFTAAIATCSSSWQTVLTLLGGLKRAWLKADTVAVSAAVTSLARAAMWEATLQLVQMSGVRVDRPLFNAMIKSCAKAKEWELALSLLRSAIVKTLQVRPDTISFNSILVECQDMWQTGLSLMASLLVHGIAPDSASISSVSYASSASGVAWTRTLDLLSAGLRPDACAFLTHSWQKSCELALGSLQDRVGCLGRAGLWKACLSFSLLLEKCCPEERTNPSGCCHTWELTAMACGTSSQWQHSLNIFQRLNSVKVEMDLQRTWPPVLRSCGLAGHEAEALQLLEQLRLARADVDVGWYGTLIDSSKTSPDSILREMGRASVNMVASTYRAALAAFAKCRDVQSASELLADMALAGEQLPTYSCNLLLAADSEKAFDFFQQLREQSLEPNVVTFSTVISACQKQEDAAAALDLLASMDRSHIVPNTITYSSAISACERAHWTELALSLFHSMQRVDLQADCICYNSVISACEKGKRAETALDLLETMRATRVQTTGVTYSAVISACDKCSLLRRGCQLLGDMKDAQIESSVVAYNALISACSRLSRLSKALRLYGQLKDESLQPTVVTCSSLVNACENSDRLSKALQVFEQMRGLVKANLVVYNAILSACERASAFRRACRLFEDMRLDKLQPDIISYNCLIGASCKSMESEAAWALLQQMETGRVSADVVTYVTLLLDADVSGPGLHVLPLERLSQAGIRHLRKGMRRGGSPKGERFMPHAKRAKTARAGHSEGLFGFFVPGSGFWAQGPKTHGPTIEVDLNWVLGLGFKVQGLSGFVDES